MVEFPRELYERMLKEYHDRIADDQGEHNALLAAVAVGLVGSVGNSVPRATDEFVRGLNSAKPAENQLRFPFWDD